MKFHEVDAEKETHISTGCTRLPALFTVFQAALASQWLFGRLAGRPPRKAEVCLVSFTELKSQLDRVTPMASTASTSLPNLYKGFTVRQENACN